MLNIGRMAPGSHSYYLGIVASGAEDYYLAHGEEPGRWLGRGSASLHLAGEVEADQLRAVLSGADADSGQPLARHPARRVPGFDLTFRAPKSVSLLWGLADRSVAASVTAAHDAAVDAAVGYLERAAGYTRRGAGGVERVASNGFVAAGFRHRTSRANDPLLHTHVLVANLAQAVDDGVWRTLDSRALFVHARTAGFLYQAQLRFELTRMLGVEWGPVVNGHADLKAVPREWIDHFSRRRTAIVEHMQARGDHSAKAAQVATLETRQPKERHVSEKQLRDYWNRRTLQLRMDPHWVDRAIGATTVHRADVGGLYEELVEHEGLTAQSSTFTRRDVLRAVAERLPTGAQVDYIEQVADAIIAHDRDRVIALGPVHGQLTNRDVIRTVDGNVVPADQDEPRYTTQGLMRTERHAVTRAVGRLDAGIATVAPQQLNTVIRSRTLSEEQSSMVRRLTTSGHGVDVVVGRAGTGKTYTLDAARAAWNAAGIPVTGAALAARAAVELEDSAGIPSMTITRLLRLAEDDRMGSPLAPRSVLVVDEAGMVGTRTLARLLDHAEHQQVKVVLVGDHRQLPEIDAGGLFRQLTIQLPSVELTDNRRQQHTWEIDALDQLRHGDPSTAVATYDAHDRIVTTDSAEDLRNRLVDDWWKTFGPVGAGPAVMIALRRADVDDLNGRARRRMLAAGRIAGDVLEVDGQRFQAGDQIVCLRNDRSVGVVNGTRATITHVDVDGRTLQITGGDGVQTSVPARYIDDGHVTHGYAITGHKAQGLTVDHAFVLGSDDLYREWGYVAMSRGRHTNRLYLCNVGDRDELHHRSTRPSIDQANSVSRRLRRTRAEQPVSEQTDVPIRKRAAMDDHPLRISRGR
ncbi:MAG: MobF family relaxase [Nitriliruptoraceae bacterium]